MESLNTESDVAECYEKYNAFMRQLQTDLTVSNGNPAVELRRVLEIPRLGFEQFRRMWRVVLRDGDLARHWERRLSLGYEKEKGEIRAILGEAFSHVSGHEGLKQSGTEELGS